MTRAAAASVSWAAVVAGRGAQAGREASAEQANAEKASARTRTACGLAPRLLNGRCMNFWARNVINRGGIAERAKNKAFGWAGSGLSGLGGRGEKLVRVFAFATISVARESVRASASVGAKRPLMSVDRMAGEDDCWEDERACCGACGGPVVRGKVRVRWWSCGGGAGCCSPCVSCTRSRADVTNFVRSTCAAQGSSDARVIAPTHLEKARGVLQAWRILLLSQARLCMAR